MNTQGHNMLQIALSALNEMPDAPASAEIKKTAALKALTDVV